MVTGEGGVSEERRSHMPQETKGEFALFESAHLDATCIRIDPRANDEPPRRETGEQGGWGCSSETARGSGEITATASDTVSPNGPRIIRI